MDELGFNKIAAAVLATALGFMLIKEVPHLLVHHAESSDIPAYALEIPEVGTEGPAIEVPFPSPDFIAAMNESRGEKVFKKCLSCHTAEGGGANGTGPNLYGVVGSLAAQHAGFKYSSAMTNAGLTWDYETLDGYLTKPTKYVSGTAMNFVGLKKEADRAAVIEYLRLKSDNPIAPPVAAEAPMEEEAALPDPTESEMEEPTSEDVPSTEDSNPAEVVTPEEQ